MSSISDLYYVKDPEMKLDVPNYGPDPKKPLEHLKEKEEFEKVIGKMENSRFQETYRSFGNFIVGMSLSAAAAAIAYIVSDISVLILELSLAPLLISNPLESLILLVGGLVVGGAVCYTLYCKYAKPYFTATQQHWDFSEKFVEHIDYLNLLFVRRFPKK